MKSEFNDQTIDLLRFTPHPNVKLLPEDSFVQLDSQNLDYDVYASLKPSGNHTQTLTLRIEMRRKMFKSLLHVADHCTAGFAGNCVLGKRMVKS